MMQTIRKRMLSYFLTLVMIFTMLPAQLLSAAGIQDQHLIINQVYGGGGKGDTPISHSFIELYNPTAADIPLGDYEISYSSNRGGDGKHLGNTDGEEKFLQLAGVTLPAKTSYLIIGAVENTTPSVYAIENIDTSLTPITTSQAYYLGKADQEWAGRHIDNDQYIIQLEKNGETIDAVTVNTKETATEGAQISSISKQKTIRRLYFKDTDSNGADFEVLEYKEKNSDFVKSYRPRSLRDGEWEQQAPEETLEIDKILGFYNDTATLKMELIARYDTKAPNADGGVAEIVKYNPDNQSFYLVNGQTKTLDIVSIADLKADPAKASVITTSQSINIATVIQAEDSAFQYGDLTSIDINTKEQVIAVAVQAQGTNEDGYVAILAYDGTLQKLIKAGKQPDMLTFTPDGNTILVANEGEPREGYSSGIDPMGSVTLIDLKDGIENAEGKNITFEVFDNRRQELIDHQVILKKDASPSVDLEPEYIVVNGDSSKAYVALQEANAIAILDIASGEFEAVKGLGFKDHSKAGNELDLIKDEKIEIKNQEVLGVYMPDGISLYEKDGNTYILTANEGDAREWGEYNNIAKIKIEDETVQTLVPALHDGLDENNIYVLGGRSFSIWNAEDMSLVYDSGSDFEKITAEKNPDYFNVSNDNLEKDDRSGKKGPEPEDIKIAEVNGRTYAYIGLERTGGIMVYDVTNPLSSKFVNYITTREYTADIAGDVAPEGLYPISKSKSPTGTDLLLAANEVSGTVAIFEATKGVDEPVLNENKISVLSDIHVYSQSLGIEGAAFEEYIANDRKMIAESELIFGAAIETIKANDSGIVLVAGDLTKDGERVNHELVASKLKELENLGKRVFVINGNHDISNAKSLRYEEDKAVRIPTVSTNDFREIYNDFGYSEAIAKHEDTLSYVVELTPEYRMIVVDTCVYNNDIANPSSETRGAIKPETLGWIKEQIKTAQKDGKKVIGMMHHGIVPHTDVQPAFFPEYLIEDYAQRAEELADAGLLAVFTGHFHSQDIAAAVSQRGNKIYDIETGSTVTYPVPIRDVEINGDTLTVTSQKVDKVAGVDLGGKDFETYASEFLMVGLEQQVPGMLAGVLMGQGVPQEQAVLQAQAIAKTTITGTPYTVGQFLAGCMFKHYVGDEQQDAVTQAIISGFITNADPMYKLLGSVASQLATDTDAGTENQVADNDAVITFKAVVPEEPDQTITITYTNDMHGRVFPDANNKGMIGIDKIAAISKNTKNSILVDIGDTIHGLPIANTTQGKNVVELLGLAGYELMVPGNHDFNYGSAKLKEYAQDTTKGFDIISANIVNKADQTPYLPGTAIREINGVKIGFFALTTQTTPIVTNPVNVETLEFKAYLPASQAAIKKLKEDGAELIVGLAHVSRADIRALAGSLKEDVAVIIDAHDHISTNEMIEGVLIASAGQYEENIGQIILSLDDDKKVLTKTAKLITKAETETITGDAAVKARATQMMEAVNALFNEKIGVSEVLLDSSRGSATTKGVRNAEMPLGNLVADAMRTILHTDTALTNGGGLRANIGIGDVTKGHLNAVLPFGNYGVVKEVTPKALKQILENGVKIAPEPLGGFPQVSGMKFEYNPNAVAGSKVTKITINDKVLNLNDDTTKYTLATNDFMANGGDGYEAIKALKTISNGDSLDVIFENYVKEILQGRITAQSTQLEGRILAKVPSSGGGGGGDGGDSSSNPPATPPPVVVPEVSLETIQVKAEVTKAMVDSLIAKAAADGNVEKGTPVEIKIQSPAGAAKVTAEFTKDVFNQIAAGIKTDIVIKTEIASITLSPEVMNSISSQAKGNITISAEKVEKSDLPQTAGDRPVYEFTIKNGEQTIASFGDSAVKVSIPYTLKTGEKSQAVVIYYLNGANQITPVTSSYNAGTETVDFITNHFSKYMVGYHAVSFGDIKTHWAKDVIEFVVSREIFGGTGSDTFGPNDKMTRGMLVTVLGRLANAETAGISSSFTDVKKEAYYAPYVAWAVEKGIMSGVGANKFDPNRPVTREELTVILTNYIAFSGHELTPSAVKPEAFGDSSHISTWAQKSVTQAQNAGLISSKANNMFDPKGQSTRAEVAALIQRTIQISLK